MNPTSITVLLDEQPLRLSAGSSLAQLLEQLRRPPESVATALNGRFVPRQARPGTRLADGDQVLFFHPITGG